MRVRRSCTLSAQVLDLNKEGNEVKRPGKASAEISDIYGKRSFRIKVFQIGYSQVQ